MNKTKYANYQEYFKHFLGGWSFEGGDETLTIKAVTEEEVFDKSSQSKTKKLCLWFEEKELPMVLNVTNSATIAEVVGSDKMDDWMGKQIVVGQRETRAFGENKVVIRVLTTKPSNSIKNRANSAQISKIEELIENGRITNKEAMLKHFKVSKVEDLTEKQAEDLIKMKGGE